MEARYDNQSEVAKHLSDLHILRLLEQNQWTAVKESIASVEYWNTEWCQTHTMINDLLAASGISVEQFAEMIEKGEL